MGSGVELGGTTGTAPPGTREAGSVAEEGHLFPGTPAWLWSWLRERPRLNRLLRYAATSGVATLVSEVTLVGLYAGRLLGASGSSIVANVAGAVPSYLLSRYWIWPEADRTGAARQVTLYWVTSVVSLVVSTAGTSLAAAHAPAGHTAHTIVVGTSYIGTYALLWVAKYLVYQRVIFSRRAEAGSGA